MALSMTQIRLTVARAVALSSGVPEAEVRLEVDRDGFAGISRGRRLRLDFDERPIGIDQVVYLEGEVGLEPAVRGERELGVFVRCFSDDVATDDSWAHSILSRVGRRIWLPQVQVLLEAVGLVLRAAEQIVPSPAVEIDRRQQSVASTRLTLGYAFLEAAGDPPGATPVEVDYFDRVEITLEAHDAAGPVATVGPDVVGPVA